MISNTAKVNRTPETGKEEGARTVAAESIRVPSPCGYRLQSHPQTPKSLDAQAPESDWCSIFI